VTHSMTAYNTPLCSITALASVTTSRGLPARAMPSVMKVLMWH